MIEYVVFFGLVGLSFVIYGLYLIRGNSVEVDPYTRELLKTESPIERRLLRAIWSLNIDPVSQYSFGPYRLDFALPWLKLAIEADGKDFHTLPHQIAHDKKRDNYLKRHGWKTLRFTGKQINGNIQGVVRKIEKELNKKSPSN